jgi:hypothetical protein
MGRFALRAASASVGCLLLLAPATAMGQAWLPEKGEGSVSVLFTNALSTKHYLPSTPVDRGRIDSNTVLFDVTYGVSERVAISASLPLVTSRYRGLSPHKLNGQTVALDDGSWHTTAQDVRFAVRYNLTRGALVVTPFLGTVVPSHDYAFFAHASPGRNLPEAIAGVSVGKLFAERGTFVQGRYGFAVAERIIGRRPLHSEGQLEVGYFLSPSVRFVGLASGRYAHNGVDLTSPSTLPPEQYYNHDRISREQGLNVGAAASFSVSESLDLFVSAVRTLTARNGHGLNRGITSGVSWTFRQADAVREQGGKRAQLARCVCEKNSK